MKILRVNVWGIPGIPLILEIHPDRREFCLDSKPKEPQGPGIAGGPRHLRAADAASPQQFV